MKVMVIVKASRASEAGELPGREFLTEMGNFNEALANAGILLSMDGLHPSSKGKRVRFSGRQRTVTDGPFAETKELIAGYWVWQVKSMDEAVEWARRCPNPQPEGWELELRPVFGADDFGCEFTPELREQEASVRAQSLGLGAIRFEAGGDLQIAGLNASYTMQTRSNIPAQWHSFAPHIGKVPGQVGNSSYGVCWNTRPDGSFNYLAGVEIGESAKLPAGFERVALPPRRYAVFTHAGHVSTLPQTIDTIWNRWAPECGLKIAKAPCFERYTAEFDSDTGTGGMEIWIPLDESK